jgi:hypothetical protein
MTQRTLSQKRVHRTRPRSDGEKARKVEGNLRMCPLESSAQMLTMVDVSKALIAEATKLLPMYLKDAMSPLTALSSVTTRPLLRLLS